MRFFSPDGVINLQIAFNADSCQVDQRTNKWTPIEELTQNGHAQPVSACSTERNVAKFDCLRREEKEAADKIEQILVEYQHLLLVLFRGYEGVQDKSIESRSHKSDDYDSALKIETGTTRRR